MIDSQVVEAAVAKAAGGPLEAAVKALAEYVTGAGLADDPADVSDRIRPYVAYAVNRIYGRPYDWDNSRAACIELAVAVERALRGDSHGG